MNYQGGTKYMVLVTNQHLDEDQIDRYSMGTLPEEESAHCEEHLLICESCRNKLTEADDFASAMREASLRLRRHIPVQETNLPLMPRMFPLFSALVLIVVIVLVGLRVGSRVSRAPAFAVNLVSTRGAGIDAKAPPEQPLLLNLELSGLPAQPSYRVEMVDRLGNAVWKGVIPSRNSKTSASVPGQPDGVYFVRVYAFSGELLREYGIELVK